MFTDIKFLDHIPKYVQIKDYIKKMMDEGLLLKDEKLPSTRELAGILNVSRNCAVSAYNALEEDDLIYFKRGRGAFISGSKTHYEKDEGNDVDWNEKLSKYALECERLDLMKSDFIYSGKDIISFRSIAPDEKMFNMNDFKRAFLNVMSREGAKLLNYGYAKGYKPLIDYLMDYMKDRGIDASGKDIIITNGFTEGFDMILSAFTKDGDSVICENPTHNTAIKMMKLHNLNIEGIDMEHDGIDIDSLKKKAADSGKYKMAYLVPSYHNPTGIVMSPEKRVEVCEILSKADIPLVEDGFSEELRFYGAHASPVAALYGKENGCIYVGSFSKILFPGMRIGWIFADKKVISCMESIKRAKNIHTSVLDQAVLFEYFKEGSFKKYINKIRRIYRRKYDFALKAAGRYIPHTEITGEGGFYIFVVLDGINSRELLKRCIKKGAAFMPGDIFYTDGRGFDTMRLGFAKTSFEDIEKGFNIIGEEIKNMKGNS